MKLFGGVDARPRRLLPFLFAAVALIFYYSLMSHSFDEWDSVQLALAMERYDISQHTPHPPGYPVYVFLGWVLFRILGSHGLALNLLSSVCGALTLVPFYLLVEDMSRRTSVAVPATLLLMISPQFWLNSEKALADVPAVFFAVTAIYLFYRYAKGGAVKHVALGACVLGLGVGVRITDLAFVGVMFLSLLKRRSLRHCVLASAVFVASCLAWFVPMAYIGAGGVEGYFALSLKLWHAAVIRRDSVFRADLTVINLYHRLVRFAEVLLRWGYLAWFDDLYGRIRLILILVLGASLVRYVDWKHENFRFMAVWLLPYAVFMFLFMGLWGVERYMLPMVPPLAVLLAAGSNSLLSAGAGSRHGLDRWFGVLRGLVTGGLVALLFVPTVGLVWLVHSQPPPTVQLVHYVRQNYRPHQVVVIVMDEYRKFQFYAPEYQIYGHVPLEPIPKPDEMLNEMRRMGWKTYYGRVVLVTGSAWRYLAPSFPWARPVLLASFSRDPLAGSFDDYSEIYRWA